MRIYELLNIILFSIQTLVIFFGGRLAIKEYRKWQEVRKSDEVRRFKKLFGLLIRTNVELFDYAARAYRGELPNGLDKKIITEQDTVLSEFDKYIKEYFVIYPKLGFFLQQRVTDDIRTIRPEIDRVSDAISRNDESHAKRILDNRFNEKHRTLDIILEKEKRKLNDYFTEEIN